MQLIKKIEINYLRSIYSANLDRTGDLSLFFGRNDSGKSNILRALNLFFNESTDPASLFDFEIDMSDLRKKKAAEAKGRQFVSIKITFNVPENYKRSLGNEVAIKKQWNRTHEVTQTSFPTFTGGKAGRLSRFLNEIDFTYIPAVKDLSVYADLIERMYSSAAENEEMLSATSTFIDAIGTQTETLTKQLGSIFGRSTKLSPPTDMATLFRNLDFSHGEEGHSLFKQKGDGVKARHLPELLRFINEHEPKKKFFLWGFEEPENSLDLSAATQEAKRFSEFAKRKDTQIFITSHSSAFYLAPPLDGVSTKRYFVEKQNISGDGDIVPIKATSSIDKIEDADKMMKAAGLLELPFVIRKLQERSKDQEILQQNIEYLQGKLASLSRPTIFLEGSHDVNCFPKLLDKFKFPLEFEVKKLKGTPNNTSAFISAIAEEGGLNSSAKTLFIFDNDKSGRASFKNIAGKNADCTGKERAIISENISAMTLPYHNSDFLDFIEDCRLPEGEIKFPFELMLANADLAKWVNKKSKSTEWRASIHNEYYQKGQKLCVKLQSYDEGTLNWLFARMVSDDMKSKYLAKALAEIDESDPFLRSFVETIEVALST